MAVRDFSESRTAVRARPHGDGRQKEQNDARVRCVKNSREFGVIEEAGAQPRRYNGTSETDMAWKRAQCRVSERSSCDEDCNELRVLDDPDYRSVETEEPAYGSPQGEHRRAAVVLRSQTEERVEFGHESAMTCERLTKCTAK